MWPTLVKTKIRGRKKALKAEPLNQTACSIFIFPPKQIDFQLLAPLTVEFTLCWEKLVSFLIQQKTGSCSGQHTSKMVNARLGYKPTLVNWWRKHHILQITHLQNLFFIYFLTWTLVKGKLLRASSRRRVFSPVFAASRLPRPTLGALGS